MTDYTVLTFSAQSYNLDVSFFVELRRRILNECLLWRSEIRIHAFAAVDGALWLDMNSFGREYCRFNDCVASSSNLSARYAVERMQLTSRCTPEAHESSNCRCTLVPGTLVVLPSLLDFRECNLKLEAEGVCGSISVGALGDLCLFGVNIDPSILCPDNTLSGIHSLRRFLMILHMDLKACRCHFALASPTAKPKIPWYYLSRASLNASGKIELLEGSQLLPPNIGTHDLYKLFTAINSTQLRCGFFACCCRGNEFVFADICKVYTIDEESLSLNGVQCDYKDVLIGGIGCISSDGQLPRHWSTVIMSLQHILRLYGKVIHLMIIDTKTLNVDVSTMLDTIPGYIAFLYEIRFGAPMESADYVTISCGYQVNPDHTTIGVKKHEHVFDFIGAIDPNVNYRIDAELHLQMMRWRIKQELKSKEITKLRICIIGAGALGCQVIRQLLAWGVHNITVIDHGRVTNATRQCLYRAKNISDHDFKAISACCEIEMIYPGANAISLNMSVPMPGHFMPDDELTYAYQRLNDAMLASDVIFLLTDSKESRWLPSLIGAACTRNYGDSLQKSTLEKGLPDIPMERSRDGPLIISAGVAFDSWMVIRHGYGSFDGGCYFCSDVQSPSDSISGRAMDETCTIVKPGTVTMCAAAAVELLVSLTQHPDGFQALHGSSSCLGEVPHAIRMSLSDLSVNKIYVERSDKCICCSPEIVGAFNSDPLVFLRKALQDSTFLSKISGLDKVLHSIYTYDGTNVRIDSDFVIL